MLNNEFKESTFRSRIDNLHKVITKKMSIELDESIFEKILNYVPLEKQCYIENMNNDQYFSENVFNGYKIIDDEKKYCVQRYNIVNILGDYIPGYRQNNKIVKNTTINANTDFCVALVISKSQGWYKNKKIPILDKSFKLCILDRRKICV